MAGTGWLTLKRTVILLLLSTMIIGTIAWVARDRILSAFIDRAIVKQLSVKDKSNQADGLRLIVVGSGNNKYPPGRGQPCYAVIAGEQLLVFDAGLSAARNISLRKLPMEKIRAVFVTHYHSDHMTGLGALIEAGWLFGDKVRDQSLEIYGPRGINTVVHGFNLAYEANTTIRHAVHDIPLRGRIGVAKQIMLNGDLPVKTYDYKGLKVYAFPVDHQNPLARHPYTMNAARYRVEYKGRTIVLSGDTKVMPKMADYAKRADILVHDAYDLDVAIRAIELMKKTGRDKLARLIERGNAHHTTTFEAAAIAQKAQVEKLVLSHVRHAPRLVPD